MDEQKLNELVTQLHSTFSQGIEVLNKYKNNTATLQECSQVLKELNEIEGKISIAVGDVVRAYYIQVGEEKRRKAILELGYAP